MLLLTLSASEKAERIPWRWEVRKCVSHVRNYNSQKLEEEEKVSFICKLDVNL